ncbi:hypothetical protein L2U69_18665 [Zavarzinia compransoris]|uniref:hypothetical protein n=1 Tax=Zavarzinia marina TaxID=2911065 RepID=UPI001F427766|nr:hypothetical protein [Zavarzinia marina]MCF4167675.1 hypothetical protein [Zavarzinia marina]
MAHAIEAGDGHGAVVAENTVKHTGLEPWFAPIWLRNTALDELYYDVETIPPDERDDLSALAAREGTILLVPPSGAGPVRPFATADEFAAGGGIGIRAIAVAGVGSTALGAAALARNVADAIGEPVAAVVSGYGYGDLPAEMLGGFFLFGTMNSLRHLYDIGRRLTRQAIAGSDAFGDLEDDFLAHISPDTRMLADLLCDPRFSFDLLVGHSKGNLVISEALYSLMEHFPVEVAALAGRATIVTLAAIVSMPSIFHRVIDVIGSMDVLGAVNSRFDLRWLYPPEKLVPGATHSTNTHSLLVPHPLRVTELLTELLPPRPKAPGPRRRRQPRRQ